MHELYSCSYSLPPEAFISLQNPNHSSDDRCHLESSHQCDHVWPPQKTTLYASMFTNLSQNAGILSLLVHLLYAYCKKIFI